MKGGVFWSVSRYQYVRDLVCYSPASSTHLPGPGRYPDPKNEAHRAWCIRADLSSDQHSCTPPHLDGPRVGICRAPYAVASTPSIRNWDGSPELMDGFRNNPNLLL